MESLTTEGVIIRVQSSYEEDFSKPQQAEFVFSYHIEIENDNNFPIQLLSRKWYVFDSTGEQFEVEGDGVIGQQPVIHPESNYEYESGTNLHSPIGRMRGYYIMQNVLTGEEFKVYIPEFDLVAKFILN